MGHFLTTKNCESAQLLGQICGRYGQRDEGQGREGNYSNVMPTSRYECKCYFTLTLRMSSNSSSSSPQLMQMRQRGVGVRQGAGAGQRQGQEQWLGSSQGVTGDAGQTDEHIPITMQTAGRHGVATPL